MSFQRKSYAVHWISVESQIFLLFFQWAYHSGQLYLFGYQTRGCSFESLLLRIFVRPCINFVCYMLHQCIKLTTTQTPNYWRSQVNYGMIRALLSLSLSRSFNQSIGGNTKTFVAKGSRRKCPSYIYQIHKMS